jgi:hypothetical protein
MPLVQGMAWSLIVSGWRYMNRETKFSGQTVGAKLRRWWWGVNNWKVPEDKWQRTVRDKKLAESFQEFVTTRLSSGGPGDD